MIGFDYKGYRGTINIDRKDGSMYGIVLNIPQELKYHGNSAHELKCEFERVVDEFILASKGSKTKDKEKYSGEITIKVPQYLHKRISMLAKKEQRTVKEYIVRLLENTAKENKIL